MGKSSQLLSSDVMLINGHNLHIEQYGPEDEPAVVLLHHGLGSVQAWKAQIPMLVQSGRQVIAYDRWGYGGSDARPTLDVPAFATDLLDLHAILAHYCAQPASLIGHSDGGTIALYFAAQYPELVRGVVTVAAHIYIEPKMEVGILGVKRAFNTDERFRLGLRHAHGEKYERTFYNWYDGWHSMQSESWDMRPILPHISCPVLVVQGDNDEHATPQHAMDIDRGLPKAELWLVPGAGHMLPQENATVFNPKLLKFLDSHRDG